MLRALFFDMDGTLTRPQIDWQTLRARVGVPAGQPIMEYIEALPAPQRRRRLSLLEEIEMEAAARAALNPGAAEVLQRARRMGLRTALITNNHRRAMHLVVERFTLCFDLLLSREDARLKPAPDLLLLALERLHLRPRESCFVGDGVYDQMASAAAGIPYVHLERESTVPGGVAIAHLKELWEGLGKLGLVEGGRRGILSRRRPP